MDMADRGGGHYPYPSAPGPCPACPPCYGVIGSGALMALGGTLLLLAGALLLLLLGGAAVVAFNWEGIRRVLHAASESGKPAQRYDKSRADNWDSQAQYAQMQQQVHEQVQRMLLPAAATDAAAPAPQRDAPEASQKSRDYDAGRSSLTRQQLLNRRVGLSGSVGVPLAQHGPDTSHSSFSTQAPGLAAGNKSHVGWNVQSVSNISGQEIRSRRGPNSESVENTVVDRSPSFDADTSIEQQRAVLHAKAMALITEANNPGQPRDSQSSLGSLVHNNFTPRRPSIETLGSEHSLRSKDRKHKSREQAPEGRSQGTNASLGSVHEAPSPPVPKAAEDAGSEGRPSLWDVPMELLEGIRNKGTSKAHNVDVSHADGFIDRLQLGEQLGGGAFGQVYLCLWEGMEAAVKLIEMVVEPNGNTEAIETFLAEAEVAALLRHPNIVQVYKVNIERTQADPDDPQQASASNSSSDQRLTYRGAIVMEYCEKGTLADAMKNDMFTVKRDGQTLVDLQLMLNVAEDVARGMMFLHSQEVLHADLKPNNVLLKEVGNGIVAKLTDFGLSVQMTCSQTHVSQHQTGTLDHMAPEVMMEGKTSKRSDVYSFGILLWELFCYSRPYIGMRDVAIVHKVVEQDLRPVFPTTAPREYVSLATACWDKDPQKRPNFSEITRRVQNMGMILNKLLSSQGPEFKLVKAGEVPPPETGGVQQPKPAAKPLDAALDASTAGASAGKPGEDKPGASKARES